ncbi:MAG: hypothetical protein GX858_06710, partial [Clostridiales bacterium]|nr:hypothetical protein [Clostridiales bacterium]
MIVKNRQYESMRFQNLSRKNYFEGWYYKQVTPDEKTVICFIPGVSVHQGETIAFIQVILAQKSGETWEHTTDWLDYSEYSTQDEPFFIEIGGNVFRRDGLKIDFAGEQLQVSGEV